MRDTDACIASWHQTVLSVYRGPASIEHVRVLSDECRAIIERNPVSATYLSVIERSSPAPTDRVRRVLAAWSRDVVAKMAAGVIVAEGGGFKNALVRGVGVALTVLAPHRVPFKFAGNVAEGAQLLSRYIPEAQGGVAALARAVEEVRAGWR